MRFATIIPVFLLFLFNISQYGTSLNTQDLSKIQQTIDTTDEPPFVVCLVPVVTTPSEDWQEYIIKNLELYSLDVDTIPVGTYTVIVRFMIDKKGWIKNVLIEKDPGYGLGKRVLKVVSAYKGR